MRRLAPSALSIAATLALAGPAAAATCKCPTNYSPYGAPWAGSGQMFWECVRKPGTAPPHAHPAPLPCKGQTHKGPA